MNIARVIIVVSKKTKVIIMKDLIFVRYATMALVIACVMTFSGGHFTPN